MKRLNLVLGALAAMVFASLTVIAPAFAADHGDAPLSKANHAEDLADVYAFGGDAGNLVLVMTVNPLSMPGDAPTFDQAGLYQFKIDNNGDAVPDVAYDVTFGAPAADGTQTVKVQKATGAAADTLSASGTELISGSTTAATAAPKINTNGTVKLFAGLRDDPFFFDLTAFKAGLKFRNPGNDFFLGLNVSAIVLSVPPSDFQASGSTAAGVWAVTSKSGAVIDRMGRPAIATVFIPADQKDNFNNTKPANDVAMWKATVVASLNKLGSDPKLADTLLPDVLTFDTSKALHFLNGRALTDDVIDAELQLITGNSAASDNVSNDSTFLAGFPYLGSPNTSPAPTPIAVT
ncbi:MAG: DUF4331 domain-containing protein, partial [Chloroflexota bacterium]|nr:DUF4331 domain-containing protein [Chloroflexota bacterium]